MAEDLKISQLPAVTNPTGAEMIPVALDGRNGKLTLEQIVDRAQARMETVASGFQEQVMNVQRVSDDAYELGARLRDARADERKQFGFVGGLGTKGLLSPASSSWHSSDFIPINHSEPIVCNLTTNSDNSYKDGGIYFYDANQNFISFINVTTHVEYEIAIADIPEGAVFFRASEVKQATDGWYRNGSTYESREGATSDAISKSKVALFDDMWVKLTNGFTSIDRVTNPAKPYICNGVPLSYEDALVVAKYGNYEMAMNILDNRNWGTRDKIPTLKATLPTIGINRLDYPNIWWHPTGLRKIQFSVSPNDFPFILAGNLILTRADLEEIADVLVPSKQCYQIGAMNGDMPYATGLTTLWIKELDHNITINLTALKLECWQYLVTNAANSTTTITVTVHPDVYAKLSDTSNTEWHKVMTDAAAKNISFATNA